MNDQAETKLMVLEFVVLIRQNWSRACCQFPWVPAHNTGLIHLNQNDLSRCHLYLDRCTPKMSQRNTMSPGVQLLVVYTQLLPLRSIHRMSRMTMCPERSPAPETWFYSSSMENVLSEYCTVFLLCNSASLGPF